MPHGRLRVAIRPIVAGLVGQGRRWADACGTDRFATVMILSTLSGNLAHLPYRRADGSFVGVDVDDGSRQPISLLSVATAMRLPYQTARGRAPMLEATGLIQRRPEGIIVPAAWLATPPALALLAAEQAALVETVGQMILVDYPLPRGLTVAKIERLPAALVARLMIDYKSRAIETIVAMHGDIANSTIFAAIAAANVAHLVADPAVARRYAAHDEPPPDALRRPIPLRSLARELGMPFETVRRRIQLLIEAGDVVATADGLIIPASVLVQRRFHDNNTIIVRHFRRLLLDVVRLSR